MDSTRVLGIWQQAGFGVDELLFECVEVVQPTRHLFQPDPEQFLDSGFDRFFLVYKRRRRYHVDRERSCRLALFQVALLGPFFFQYLFQELVARLFKPKADPAKLPLGLPAR